MKNNAFAYLTLTKPRISLLFAISGLALLLVEGSLTTHPQQFWMIVIGIFLVGGSANAFNQYFERDVDKKMERTAKKRPLPLGLVTPKGALIFSFMTGCAGTTILLFWGGWLAGFLGLATILFYSLFYTLWLKPRTPYNIVIGGVAGATGPLIGWAAATGELGWIPFLFFLIIFFWTPPHFWALALCYKEDYANVGYPMLPNVAGDDVTRKQILIYAFLLFPLTLLPFLFENIGGIYMISALLLGLTFCWKAFSLYRQKDTKASRSLFGFSIVYLLLLFIALIADALASKIIS